MSYGSINSDREAFQRTLIEDTVFSARKSGLVAYLLWTFLGSIGAHNFYLGRPKAGGLQMAGTLFAYCTIVSDDPWPLVGYFVGTALSISVFIDALRIPGYIVAYSERLRGRLEDDMAGSRGA